MNRTHQVAAHARGRRPRRRAAGVLCALLAAVTAAPAQVMPPLPETAVEASRLISLNFRDAPLDQVLDFYAELTGRTLIRAPYEGQVLEKNVDVGQFVSTGTVLARVYATDYVEIRVPLSGRQLEFVDLPERFRGETEQRGTAGPEVVVKADIGRREWRWSGRIVRAEGAIDTRTRQLFVVAQVDDPYVRGADGQPPLRIGQFVAVEIMGRVLENAFVLPRSALRDAVEVLIVDDDSRLQRRAVGIAWTDRTHAVVTDGLAAGDVVNVTPLAVAANGTLVAATIDGVAPPPRRGSPADQAAAEGRPR